MEESFAGYLFLLRKKYEVTEEGLWCRTGVPRELWERWASAHAWRPTTRGAEPGLSAMRVDHFSS